MEIVAYSQSGIEGQIGIGVFKVSLGGFLLMNVAAFDELAGRRGRQIVRLSRNENSQFLSCCGTCVWLAGNAVDVSWNGRKKSLLWSWCRVKWKWSLVGHLPPLRSS